MCGMRQLQWWQVGRRVRIVGLIVGGRRLLVSMVRVESVLFYGLLVEMRACLLFLVMGSDMSGSSWYLCGPRGCRATCIQVSILGLCFRLGRNAR